MLRSISGGRGPDIRTIHPAGQTQRAREPLPSPSDHQTSVPTVSIARELPPAGAPCLPLLPRGSDSWRQCIRDWTESDVRRGLLYPLKDWKPEWRKYHGNGYIQRAYVGQAYERYGALYVNPGASTYVIVVRLGVDGLLARYPDACLKGFTQLYKEIRAESVREKGTGRRSINGTPEERARP